MDAVDGAAVQQGNEDTPAANAGDQESLRAAGRLGGRDGAGLHRRRPPDHPGSSFATRARRSPDCDLVRYSGLLGIPPEAVRWAS